MNRKSFAASLLIAGIGFIGILALAIYNEGLETIKTMPETFYVLLMLFAGLFLIWQGSRILKDDE